MTSGQETELQPQNPHIGTFGDEATAKLDWNLLAIFKVTVWYGIVEFNVPLDTV